MSSRGIEALTLQVDVEHLPLKTPFRVTGYTMVSTDVVVVTLGRAGCMGRGEAAGVYYKNEDVRAMLSQIEAARTQIEAGVSRQSLRSLLPIGGARNAIDCALWDLDARLSGVPVWRLAGLDPPRPLLTTFTLGADDPEKMAAGARGYAQARAIKLKLTGEPEDVDRVAAVREARPDVWLGVDANQGFTPQGLQALLPELIRADVQLIEQPFKIGHEADLDGFASPIPIAADESVQGMSDLAAFAGRFDVINIKLDKCGGMTEGLEMAREAHRLGLKAMVGNMVGTSLAMAPAYLVGQLCEIVDLDGPVFLSRDRSPSVRYEGGLISCPDDLWGGPAL